MAGSTSKKVIVLRFDREPVMGYVSPPTFLLADGIEVLTATGSLALVPYGDVKTVCFVKTWDESPGIEERRAFVARPKLEGLWVKLEFRDGDSMEVLLPNRLLELDARGFLGTPPDASGNTQRVFVPRAALLHCHALGVVGAGRKLVRKKPEVEGQLKMFDS